MFPHTVLVFLNVWFLLSEKGGFPLVQNPEIELLDLFSSLRVLLEKQVLSMNPEFMELVKCESYKSIDQHDYCIHQEMTDTATACVRKNISEWYQLDKIERESISECVLMELKTVAFNEKYRTKIPRDFFTNENKAAELTEQFLVNMKGLCSFCHLLEK